jgi:hypothetical protein
MRSIPVSARETVYYRKGDVLITNTRAVFGAKTYGMLYIASVAADKNQRIESEASVLQSLVVYKESR